MLILFYFIGLLSAGLIFYFPVLPVASVLLSIDGYSPALPSPGKASSSPVEQPCQPRMGAFWGDVAGGPSRGHEQSSDCVGGGPGVVGLLKCLGLSVRRAGSQPVSWLLQDTRWNGPHSFPRSVFLPSLTTCLPFGIVCFSF